MNETFNNETLAAVLASADVRAATETAVPFVLVPDGYSVKELEDTLPAPLTTRQAVALEEGGSFISYVNRFKTDETSIFAPAAQYDKPLMMRAGIDYHGKDVPSHKRHFADLIVPLSLQWQRWTAINRKGMKQAEFAAFLEQNLIDVSNPSHADILEVARSLEATKNGSFRSGVRLSNGSHQLMWSEEVQAKAGAGKIDVPEKIEITIPIFRGDVAYPISAFFRYRVQEGNLQLLIELERAEFLFDAVANALVDKITINTGCFVYRGSMR